VVSAVHELVAHTVEEIPIVVLTDDMAKLKPFIVIVEPELVTVLVGIVYVTTGAS